MSQSSTLDPQSLLEDLDGWVLGYLEDGLAREDAWQEFAKNVTVADGTKVYSVGDISRLKQSPRPAADVIQVLIQRNLSLANLLQLLHQTNLTHLYCLLAPNEVACVTAQSHRGIVAVRHGGSVTVSISTRGNPPPQLVWYRGDTPLLHHTGHTLNIPVFGPQDEGVYLCLVRQRLPPGSPQCNHAAEDQYMELWSNPIELLIEDTAPSFSLQPCDVTVSAGEQLVLYCRCDSAHPPPHFSWYRDGQLVLSSDAPSLTIGSVDASSSGQYQCVAHNRAGRATSLPCTVTVTGVTSRPVSLPVVVREPRVWCSGSDATEGVVCRGQPVQLWCSVRSSAPVSFVWVRNGRALTGSSSACHSTMSCLEGEDVHSSCLLYTPLDSDPSHLRLLCAISNSAGQVVSREVVVQVKELDLAPRVYTAQRKWALLVGNCRYEGKPLLTTLPDCQRIAATLTNLGFRCLVLADLSLSHFRNAVSLTCAFVQPGDYVMFYYGGHGYHDSGDRMIAVDGCEDTSTDGRSEEAGLRAGCLSPVWVRNALLRPLPALLFIVLDMCRTTLPNVGRRSPSTTPSLQEELPSAGRCSVTLHATSVRCAALEAPDRMSVLTKHLLRRLLSHGHQPLTSLAATLLQDVCGDCSRVREQQFPVLEADLALPRTLADSSTAPHGAVVERWKRMLSTGGVVNAEAWVPHAPRAQHSVPQAPREDHGVPNSHQTEKCSSKSFSSGVTISEREKHSAASSGTVVSESDSCTQDGHNDSFERKFEEYMAKELEGLNISKPGFIRRTNFGENCENEILEPDSKGEKEPSRAKQSRILQENKFSKHQLSTLLLPDSTTAAPPLNDKGVQAEGSLVRVRSQASLLQGDHSVANIAVVRVAVDFVGLPLLCTVALEALGCRIVRVPTDQPLQAVYRVEDLHCLAAPLAATVTFPRPERTSTSDGGRVLNSHVSVLGATLCRPSAGENKPSSNNLTISENLYSPQSYHYSANASQKCHNATSSHPYICADTNYMDSSRSKVIRLSLGLPGLAKTNLQVNDLRGSKFEEPEDSTDTSHVAFDFVNIAF